MTASAYASALDGTLAAAELPALARDLSVLLGCSVRIGISAAGAWTATFGNDRGPSVVTDDLPALTLRLMEIADTLSLRGANPVVAALVMLEREFAALLEHVGCSPVHDWRVRMARNALANARGGQP